MILNLDCDNEYPHKITWMPDVLQGSSGIVCKAAVITFSIRIAERMGIYFGIFPEGAKQVKSVSGNGETSIKHNFYDFLVNMCMQPETA